jgi:hypothetical protein
MTEDIIFKRRNRLKKHFTNTSNVLLYCYDKLSDAAKITFQIIESFDWESNETQDSKGYVFPAVATIAKLRRTSERTIRRHIHELIAVKLLTRMRRRNKASILYIEEISQEEEEHYFALMQPPKPATSAPERQAGEREQVRTDKNVRSHSHGERTKMSVAYMKENEKKENETNVNGDKNPTARKQETGMMSLSTITAQFDIDAYRYPKRTADDTAKRDYYAQTMAEDLNDTSPPYRKYVRVRER